MGFFNVGHHNLTKQEIFDEVQTVLAPKTVEAVLTGDDFGDARNLRISSAKLESMTGWGPRIPFSDTVRTIGGTTKAGRRLPTGQLSRRNKHASRSLATNAETKGPLSVKEIFKYMMFGSTFELLNKN